MVPNPPTSNDSCGIFYGKWDYMEKKHVPNHQPVKLVKSTIKWWCSIVMFKYQRVFQIAIAKPPTRSTAIHQALRFHRVNCPSRNETSRCSVDRTLVSSTDLKTIVCHGQKVEVGYIIHMGLIMRNCEDNNLGPLGWAYFRNSEDHSRMIVR